MVVFILACFLCFYLPGFLILKLAKIKLKKIELFSLSLTIGLASFTFLGFLLGCFHLRFLSWPILMLIAIWTISRYRKEIIAPLSCWQVPKTLFILLAIGIPVQVYINFPSGWLYDDGIRFWSSHGHDGIWHLALIEELKDFFPAQAPIFAGEALKNYHYFVDLLMAEFSRLFHLSSLDLYFHFFPILFSLLIGLNTFIAAYKWRRKKEIALWAVFFGYLVGSFGYLVTFSQRRHGLVNGETIFWVSQNNTILGNPPHAVAFIIMLALFFMFLSYLEKKRLSLLFLTSFLAGILIEFKAYAGTTVLAGLLFTGLFEILFKRTNSVLKVFLTALPLSLLIYLPSSSGSSEFLIWQPWWYIRTMVVASDRLNWIDLEMRRQSFAYYGDFLRVAWLEFVAFFVFLFGNLGMRFLGFLEIGKILREKLKIKTFNLFLLICVGISFLVPLFFLQKGVAYNTIQFMQYFLFFFGFLAAIAAFSLTHQRNLWQKTLLVCLIIAFSIPTVIGNLWAFRLNNAYSRVPIEELEALESLKRKSKREDIILTHPFNPYAADAHQYQIPIPIYAWNSTAYVSFFTRRRTYLSAEGQAEILGYNREKRLGKVKEFFEMENSNEAKRFLEKNNIAFIYLVKIDERLKFEPDEAGLELIFENSWSRIYKFGS